MNYSKIYSQLIESSKNRELDCYTEIHHVVPRCFGGLDESSNLVKLTAREHFIAHLLLCKIYPTHKGLRLALWMMTNVKDKRQQRHRPNSRLYEMIRLEYSESVRGENNPNYGKTHSLETREKIKISLTGLKHSEETRKKMSEARKGKKKNFKTITCPMCGKEGKGPNMSRYHFNNCKNKV